MMRESTIADATIIAAPPSVKNEANARDTDMHETKKGNQWYFDMKAHIGVDAENRLVHTAVGKTANEADVTQTEELESLKASTSSKIEHPSRIVPQKLHRQTSP